MKRLPRQKGKPLSAGKKFRLGEFMVETMIKSVAFVSIAAIVLIFIFVFKEASPIVFGTHKTEVAERGTSERAEQEKPMTEIEQEVYDPLAEEGVEKKAPQPKESLEQEVYDPLAEERDTPLAPEPSPATPSDTAIATITAAQEDSTSQAEHALDVERYEATSLTAMATGTVWQPVGDIPKYGFLPLFIGTLKVTLIALLFAAPLAILAAIYTNTFASRRMKEYIKPIIELLAGFPSVVIGFFALIVLATVFQDLFGYTFRLNAFVGGIAMGLAVIPIIYTISEDALTAVPETLRDASTALGATKWQTAFKVILPAAVPGVFAAIILGFGRAFGETMIALMATGNAPLISANPFEPVRTFSATIGAEMAEVVFGDEHYGVLFLIGALLFVFTFTMNSVVEFYIRKRLIKRIQGK